jgi:hypothetical protein
VHKGLKHALPLGRHGREGLDAIAEAEVRVEFALAEHVGQVALVVLHDDRDLARTFGMQVLAHALQRLQILLQTALLTIDDEDHRVGASEHILAHAPVLGLPGHGEPLDPDLEAAHRAEVDRQEVEQQRRLFFSVDRYQLHFVARAQNAVHALQAGGLAANANAVVDELRVDRALG